MPEQAGSASPQPSPPHTSGSTPRPTSARSRARRSRGLPTLTRFSAEQLEDLLDLLDAELRQRGVAGSVYIVGGAAIALTVNDSRRTVDVDVLTLDRVVIEAARVVAAQRQVNPNWLNTNAMSWVPPRPALATVRPEEPGLSRHIAPPEHLLAMKLVADRAQDEPDMVALVRELGMVDASAEDFADLLEQVYEGEGALAQVLFASDEDVRREAVWRGRKVVALIESADAGPREVQDG